ncbi:acyl--CoA ligase [Marivibrio halodurans]|uniref:Acyl--CoA ligase n=1 Tax=Marivibrio halodurans TaxID=2039722 RepID=A0A8J7S4T1_9PROT|nr:acyl--CoA ligase [Marivibrio halodurans]
MRIPFARTLFELLCEQAERYPTNTAVIAGGAEIGFGDLERGARSVASALRACGVRRGDRVGLIVNNRPEWLEIVFGASAVGATAVPFSTWSTREELEFLLQDSGVKVLFTLARFGKQEFQAEVDAILASVDARERYPNLQRVIVVDGEDAADDRAYARFRRGAPLGDDLPPGVSASAVDDALIIYTSGSTSFPKAVRMKHHAIVENGFNIGECQGLRSGDRVFLSPPLFWSYGGVNAMPATFTHGATLVLQGRFEAGEALDLIERHGCTAIYTLPGMTSDLLTHDRFDPSRVATLRTGLTIGSPQDIRRAATDLGIADICNIYGVSEAYGNSCVTDHAWPLERRANCQGMPLPGVELRIVDPDGGGPLPAGEPGLVEIRGYVTPGYCGASATLNETVFTSEGYFRPGDYGYLTEAGEFVFVGRGAELIKSGGINVSPAEIEEVLLRHPQVVQAGVVGVEILDRGDTIFAFVIADPGRLDADGLRAYCREHLSSYKVPHRIVFCERLPQTATGKLLRRELKRHAADLAATEPA